MYLTVFNEFQHKEVLQTVKDTININIDIANTPIDIKSLTDSDRNILYNNAKLMIKPSPIDLTFAKVQERKKEKKEILVEGNNNNNNNNISETMDNKNKLNNNNNNLNNNKKSSKASKKHPKLVPNTQKNLIIMMMIIMMINIIIIIIMVIIIMMNITIHITTADTIMIIINLLMIQIFKNIFLKKNYYFVVFWGYF
eukprot:Tbor_TRINITY_DN5551_c4_g3::TRINITY_DN5551_c4_g3_i6::g.12750::m.12750